MGKKLTASDMGKLGGSARAKALNAAERRRIAQLGGLARSKKLKKAPAGTGSDGSRPARVKV